MSPKKDKKLRKRKVREKRIREKKAYDRQVLRMERSFTYVGPLELLPRAYAETMFDAIEQGGISSLEIDDELIFSASKHDEKTLRIEVPHGKEYVINDMPAIFEESGSSSDIYYLRTQDLALMRGPGYRRIIRTIQ